MSEFLLYADLAIAVCALSPVQRWHAEQSSVECRKSVPAPRTLVEAVELVQPRVRCTISSRSNANLRTAQHMFEYVGLPLQHSSAAD